MQNVNNSKMNVDVTEGTCVLNSKKNVINNRPENLKSTGQKKTPNIFN